MKFVTISIAEQFHEISETLRTVIHDILPQRFHTIQCDLIRELSHCQGNGNLQVGPPHGCVPDTLQSTYLTIVTTCSCSIYPLSHLSTNTPTLIALSSPSCQPHFSPQPSPHSFTEGHLCSWWLFPPYSPHFLLSTLCTCCTSAFLGRATLFGQPHRTCPTSPHPQYLVGCTFPL